MHTSVAEAVEMKLDPIEKRRPDPLPPEESTEGDENGDGIKRYGPESWREIPDTLADPFEW